MTRATCPDPTELLAYQDAELPLPRQAEVQLHVQQCPVCQAGIEQSVEVGEYIRMHAPMLDDREGLTVLRDRLAELPPHGRTRRRGRLRFVAAASVAVSLALITTLAASVFMSGSVVEGGSAVARWLTSDNLVGRVTPEDYPQQPAVAPTGALSSSLLPYGIGQVGEEERQPGLVSRFYRAPTGMSMFFTAERDGSPTIAVADEMIDSGAVTTVTVSGREVLLAFGVLPDGVVLMRWSDADVVITLMVLSQPEGGLSSEVALEIVTVLMEEGVDVP